MFSWPPHWVLLVLSSRIAHSKCKDLRVNLVTLKRRENERARMPTVVSMRHRDRLEETGNGWKGRKHSAACCSAGTIQTHHLAEISFDLIVTFLLMSSVSGPFVAVTLLQKKFQHLPVIKRVFSFLPK